MIGLYKHVILAAVLMLPIIWQHTLRSKFQQLECIATTKNKYPERSPQKTAAIAFIHMICHYLPKISERESSSTCCWSTGAKVQKKMPKPINTPNPCDFRANDTSLGKKCTIFVILLGSWDPRHQLQGGTNWGSYGKNVKRGCSCKRLHYRILFKNSKNKQP